MDEKQLEDLSIKELKAKLEEVTKVRQEIVALIQDAANSIGVETVTTAAPKPRKIGAAAAPRSGTTADKVKAALSGGKVMATGDLVAALVKDGAKKGTATQFIYSKPAKKLLKKSDQGWQLK